MPSGLIRRNGRYSLRRVIPLDLQGHYSRREIVQALGTADPEAAKKLHAKAWVALDEAFDAARAELAAKGAPAPLPKVKPASDAWADRYASMSRDAFEQERGDAAYISREAMAEEFEREELEGAERRVLARLQDPKAELTDDERAIRNLLKHQSWKADLAEEQLQLVRVQAAPAPAKPKPAQADAPAQSTDDLSLDAVVDRWAKERRREGKSLDTHRAVVRQFTELAGSVPVAKVAKRDVLTFKDKLLEAGETPANVNVKLTRLRTLLNFAFQNDLIATQPATGVSVLDPDAERRKRRPFDRSELAAIFGSPVYTQDERPTQGRGEMAYWLPLLALYTGARLEELGQLRPGDVRQETYLDAADKERTAWVLNVTEDEEGDLKLKNAGSERLVPVHADLITLGFIRFAQAAQAAGQERLFPGLKANVHGRLAAKWGEWFSTYKRDVCGITDRRMVFHSFRHTFKDNARHCGMIEGVQRKIMGHAGKDVADSYGSGYGLHPLVEGMKLYRVPGLKLPPPPPAYR